MRRSHRLLHRHFTQLGHGLSSRLVVQEQRRLVALLSFQQGAPLYRQLHSPDNCLLGAFRLLGQGIRKNRVVLQLRRGNPETFAAALVHHSDQSEGAFQLGKRVYLGKERPQRLRRNGDELGSLGEGEGCGHDQTALCVARFSNRENWSRKYRLRFLSGPFLCLAMMSSAMFLGYGSTGRCLSHSSSL